MHRIFFFFFMLQPQPLKSHSLETNLSEAIFRHFQHATKETAESNILTVFRKDVCLFRHILSTDHKSVIAH